jgi:hypothetical protein
MSTQHAEQTDVGHLNARQLRAFALEIDRAVQVRTGNWIVGTQKKGMKAVKASRSVPVGGVQQKHDAKRDMAALRYVATQLDDEHGPRTLDALGSAALKATVARILERWEPELQRRQQ